MLTNHGSIGKDVDIVSTCRQIFFHIPIYGYGLFLTGIFYVFLDGIGQVSVFVWEGIRFTLAQYFIVRLGDADIECTFTGLCGDVLDECVKFFPDESEEADDDLFTSTASNAGKAARVSAADALNRIKAFDFSL